MNMKQRVSNLEAFQAEYDPNGWLDGLTAFVASARDQGVRKDSWFGVVDANVLYNLQAGYEASLSGKRGQSTPTEAWRAFWTYAGEMGVRPEGLDMANALVATAEYKSIAEGRMDADAQGVLPTLGERNAYFMADTFRAMQHGRGFLRDLVNAACAPVCPTLNMAGIDPAAAIVDPIIDERNAPLTYGVGHVLFSDRQELDLLELFSYTMWPVIFP